MIAFEIAVEGDLPVGAFDHPAAQPGPVGEVQCLEILQKAAKIAVDIDRRIGGEADEDHARAFLAGQFAQAHLRLIDLAELAGFGDAYQLAIEAIGPAVVFAGEAGAIAVTLVGDRRGAVRTDIEEGVDLAGLVAVDQHRRAGGIHRLVVARFGQFGGEGQHQRHPLEHQFHFGKPLVAIGIAGAGHPHDLVSDVGLVVLDVVKHDLGDVANTICVVHCVLPSSNFQARTIIAPS